MHGTQILLEEKQYEFLKKLAEEKKKSISQILREIIENFSKKSAVYSISSISGIADDSEAYGRDHDKQIFVDTSALYAFSINKQQKTKYIPILKYIHLI